MSTPLHLAFFESNSHFSVEKEEGEIDGWALFNNICDSLFLCDIILCFNTMQIDDNFQQVNRRSKIGKNYITGWFFIDAIAIAPFDKMVNIETNGLNSLVRLTRIGRLSKLLKLTRLLRAFKVLNKKKNPMMQAQFGFERLIFFGIVSAIFMHIISCLWLIIPQFLNTEEEGLVNTWLEPYVVDQDASIKEIYILSLYWTITTITTVGYGDISGTNSTERIFCSLIMLIGVISFSYANGSLSSILTTYDSNNVPMEEKMDILNSINKDFEIPSELYLNCKKNIELVGTLGVDFAKIDDFLDEMPPKLKI